MKRLFFATLVGLALISICRAEEAAPPQGNGHHRIALVLEGGGALGIAHVGVLKVIEELGIPVDLVVGSSMGALIGGLYSVGYDSDSLETLIAGADWNELFSEDTRSERRTILSDRDEAGYFARLDFDRKGFKSKGGLLDGRNVLNLFDRLTLDVPPDVDFDRLPIPYRAVATDLESGDAVAFGRGNISDAMRASMCFPAIFAPYRVNGRYYVDGGVADNLPVDIAKSLGADIVIAVHLKGGNPYDPEKTGLSPIDTMLRSLDQLTQGDTKARLALADFVITVDLKGYQITDFPESAAILRLGEKAAREREPELRAFIAGLGKLDAPRPRPVARGPITAVRVEGAASERQRAEAMGIYSGVIGLADYGPFLQSAYRRICAGSEYDSVRLRIDPGAEGRTLVVSLTPKPAPNDSVRLGLVYSGYCTDAISNRLIVTPSIVLRRFPAESSEIILGVPLFDSPGIQADFVQPFLNYMDFRASIEGNSGYAIYYNANAANYQSQIQSASDGVYLETGGLRNELLSFGWRFDWLSSDDISSIYSCPTAKHLSMLVLSSEFRRVDHPVLTTSGLFLKGDYTLSLPQMGSERYFQSIVGKSCAYLPIGGGNSLGIRGIMGTDFSEDSADSISAPLHYKPELSDRILFPAPLSIEEEMGSFVAGGGIDLKYSLRRPRGLVAIPLYAVFTAAAGTAIQDKEALQINGPLIQGNAALGIGFRLDDAFGVFLRAGVDRNTEKKYKPFFAADIGAIPL
jgi:NTE family protein